MSVNLPLTDDELFHLLAVLNGACAAGMLNASRASLGEAILAKLRRLCDDRLALAALEAAERVRRGEKSLGLVQLGFSRETFPFVDEVQPCHVV